MLSIHSNTNPDSQDLDIERPGDVPVFKKQLEDLSGPEFQKSVNAELETYKPGLTHTAAFGRHAFYLDVQSFETCLKDDILQEKISQNAQSFYTNRAVKDLFDHIAVRKLICDYVENTWKMKAIVLEDGSKIKIKW